MSESDAGTYSESERSQSPQSPERQAMLRRLRKQEEMEDELCKASGEEAVNVCIRVRPFNKREVALQKEQGDPYLRSVIEMPDGMGGKVVCMERNPETKEYSVVEEFQFTKSFWSVSEEQQPHAFSPVTQEDIFEVVGKPVVRSAFVGFHNCVFAYGQTGSGKTYTMMGDFSTDESGEWVGSPGIIPQLCKELFSKVERKMELAEEGITRTYDIKLSAIEIYNEQVKDLFWRNTAGRKKETILKVRMHPVEGAFVDQLTILNPTSWRQCIDLIDKGVQERTVAATLMNEESSRSHSVFQITITQTETVHVRSEDGDDRYSKPVTSKKVSRINLVDLAGSERLKKSGAQGQHLKEAAVINQSLSTLKRVIDALVQNSQEKNPKKQVVIPFRESTLTLLLSHSLGGNSKTTMIACVSPHYDNQEETLLTLRYASRSSQIINHAKVNEDNAAKEAIRLKQQMLALQKRLAGEVDDDEALDLRDQLEVGRTAMRELEERTAKMEAQVEATKSKMKREEGARYAAAFYNTLKMVMLQQQKEEMEAQAQELLKSLEETQKETANLSAELKNGEREASNYEREYRKLAAVEEVHLSKEKEMEERNLKLIRESHETKTRLAEEIELLYAQKIVNHRRRQLNAIATEESLARLQKEQDTKLTKVIMNAAEDYEKEVRRWADTDSSLQRRITEHEKEIHRLVSLRDTAEQRAAELTKCLRTTEQSHAQRMEALENEWKEKYASMRSKYEEDIAKLEEDRYKTERNWDQQLDDDASKIANARYDIVAKFDDAVRQREESWNEKVAAQCETEAARIEKSLNEATQARSLAIAKLRNSLETQIATMVAQFRRLDSLRKEHETEIAHLEAATRPVMRIHDSINEPDPPHCSPELKTLRDRLRQYHVQYRSVRPRTQAYTDPVDGNGSPSRRSAGNNSGSKLYVAFPLPGE
jgi:hypothetical protein